MNLFIYNYIADKLSGAIDKGYRKGIAGVVLLNKKEILRLADTPELFKISYTDTDKVALTNFKVEAFTVAGVMSYECEEKLKQLAVELQQGKHPLAKGEKDIKKVWVAEAYNILADYVDMPDMPPPRHLQTNLRTAMQSSYHAAQYIRLQDDSVRDLYPAYQYKTLDDVRVREAHRKLHDMIWASNDPVWDNIWPPNGWNCRCYIKPLNQEEALNSNVQPMTPPEKVSDIVRQGSIGKDFEKNPGLDMSIYGKWLKDKLKTIPNKIREKMDKLVADKTIDLVEYGTSPHIPSNIPRFLKNEIPDFVFDKLTNYTFEFGPRLKSAHNAADRKIRIGYNWGGRTYTRDDNQIIKTTRHEASHAIHRTLDLHTPSNTSHETEQFIRLVKVSVNSKITSNPVLQNKYSPRNAGDLSAHSGEMSDTEKAYDKVALADIIKATRLDYGYGHSKSYYEGQEGEYKKGAEILANTGQMYLSYVKTKTWNPYLDDFPDLKPEILKYWNNVYGQDIK